MRAFLLIGQSNMAGRGVLGSVPAIVDERIRMFREDRWQEAHEPLHDDKPQMAGIGLGMRFAQALLESGMEAVGLIPCAVGGTPLSRWLPGADLYQRACDRARKALADGTVQLAAILWHQGEGDSKDPVLAHSYGERFGAMARALRSDLQVGDCPIITGELGRFLAQRETAPHWRVVCEQLAALEPVLAPYRCVSSEGLSHKGDGLHFSAEALRAFGQRYAAAYLDLAQAG